MMKVSDRRKSQSNGKCEQAVQVVAEFLRVLKEQLEQRCEIQVVRSDPITHWMVRRAAMLLSKYEVGLDGRTPYERRQGRRCNMVVLPFGERVLYKQIRESKERKDKFDSEGLEGVSLGHNRGSNEVLMGTHHGVVRAFSFRRRDEGSRWSPIFAKGVQGLPKQPDPTRRGSSVAIRVHCMHQWWVSVPQQEVNPRFRIVPNMLTACGYTPGCTGCRQKRAGFATAWDHSEACRKRTAGCHQ